MIPSEADVVALIALAERDLKRDQPAYLEVMLRVKLHQLTNLLRYVRAGDEAMVVEQLQDIVAAQPKWASVEVLNELLEGGMVKVEDQPLAVTVHWERVPKRLRAAATSLASAYVDAYQGRQVGRRRKADITTT